MILVRNIFQLKFGQAREALATWKEGQAIAARLGASQPGWRILTDLAGPEFYTLVLEGTYASLAEFEAQSQRMMADPAWRAWYPKVAAVSTGGHREIFNIVE